MNRNETGFFLVILCLAWIAGAVASCGGDDGEWTVRCTEEPTPTSSVTGQPTPVAMPDDDTPSGSDVNVPRPCSGTPATLVTPIEER